MAFTPEQETKLIAAVQAKANRKTCPGCGTSSWSLGPETVLLQATEPGVPIPLGRGYPCIALICRLCGNTQLYNVYYLGVGEIVGLGSPKGAT